MKGKTPPRRFAIAAATLLVLAAAAGCGGGRVSEPGPSTLPSSPAAAAASDDEQVRRGAYLARVANCAGCHQEPGRTDWSGGRALVTPFGTVHAGNLTPDDETGLGRWSADDFWRAMHEGRSRDGRRLVPAFPYTSYTRMSRADSDALHAFLRTLPPVKRSRPEHQLRFPFGTQAALTAWQWLWFEPGGSGPPPQADAAPGSVARGRYLVEGPGHCLECHAPRNRFGVPGREASGGSMPGEGWWAPSLHPSSGIGEAELVELLRDGRHRLGSASGPMASVVFRSTQYWTDLDLSAVARYLMSLPPAPPLSPVVDAPPEVMSRGRRLYAERCASCHGDRGEGLAGVYPPLAGNPGVVQPSVANLVQMLRHGGFAPATRGNPLPYGMPPQDLNREEQAAVITFLRQGLGHRASAVTPLDLLNLE